MRADFIEDTQRENKDTDRASGRLKKEMKSSPEVFIGDGGLVHVSSQ